jgi:hypoxanthine phosphoribosyltransferase
MIASPAVALDLTWIDLDHLVATLAAKIDAVAPPTVIVGVLRGGMVPAVMLAHRLNVRDVIGITATRTLTEGPASAKVPVVLDPAALGDLTYEDVLIVDDVIGSGHTLTVVQNLTVAQEPARLRTAALVLNTDNWAASHPDTSEPRAQHDLVGTTCAGWVRFPWEVS